MQVFDTLIFCNFFFLKVYKFYFFKKIFFCYLNILAKNNKTYLFSSNRYWRYSDLRQMDFFYPRVIKTWRGVPADISGGASFPNGGPTVFFKGDEYLLYDDVNVKPVEAYPKKIRELLSNCR